MKILKNPLAFLVMVFAVAPAAMAGQSGAMAWKSVLAAGIPSAWYIAPIASVIALIIAFFFYRRMMADPEGNETMVSIAGHVREGAYAYLFSQYKVVAFVFILLFMPFRFIFVD